VVETTANSAANTDRRSHHRHAALCLATVVLIIGKLITWRDRWSPSDGAYRLKSLESIRCTSDRG
jgi:hypothetical protein